MLLFFLAIFIFQSSYIESIFPRPGQIKRKASLCNIEFEIPPNSKLLKDTDDLILISQKIPSAINRYKFNISSIQWLITCNRNVRKTSQVGEFEDYFRNLGTPVRNYQEFSIGNDIQACSFNRYRVIRGRKLYTHAIYFATRNYEYNIHLIPQQTNSLQEAVRIIQNPALKNIKKAFLSSIIFINKPATTITESRYQWRLGTALMSIVVFLLLFVFAFFKNRRRKKLVKSS